MAAMAATTVMAQDDDMYFDTTKKPQPAHRQVPPARPVRDEYTFSPSDYCGTTRSSDEYNRRGAYRRGYRNGVTAADSSLSVAAGASDIILLDSMSGGAADYHDTLQVASKQPDTDALYGSRYYDESEYCDDYTCYDKLRRFDGYRNNTVVVVVDPWYYNFWYDPWWYGSSYYPWYDSWYYPWYDPWYYGGVGWYGPGWSFSWGWGRGYYGRYYWGRPAWGGGIAVTRHRTGARIAGRDGSIAGRRNGTFQRNTMTGSRRDAMGSSSARQRGTSYGRSGSSTYNGGSSSVNRSSSSYPSSSSRNINSGSMTRSSGSFGGGSMSRGSMGGGGMTRSGGGGGMSRGGGMGRH